MDVKLIKLTLTIIVCLLLISCGGTEEPSDDVPTENTANIQVELDKNEPPTVSLGDDQIVQEMDVVELTADIQDDNNEIDTVNWLQVSGSPVELTVNNNSASFIAPEPVNKSDIESIEFKISVSDKNGLNAEDLVKITIEKVNEIPSISFSAPTEIEELDSVVINTTVVDIDGYISSYSWSQVSGTPVDLSNTSSTELGFLAPIQNSEAPLVFNLTVTDDEGMINSEQIEILHVRALRVADILFEDENFSSCVNEYALTESKIRAKEITNLSCRDKGIVSVNGIESLSELRKIGLILNEIEVIYLEDNSKLSYINLEGNKITSFHGLKLENLTFLDLTNNPLTSLNIENSAELSTLKLYKVNLQNFDFNAFINLNELNYYIPVANDISTIDLSQLSELRVLTISGTQISTIDLSANLNLIKLQLSGNKLEEIDLSALIYLDDVRLSSNQLTKVDLSANTQLTWANLGYNFIENISIDNNTKLSQLYIQSNPLTQETKNYLNSLQGSGINNLSITY